HAWESKEVGVGSMEIIESTPPSKVKLKLDFVKPFEAHNIVDFDIVPKGDATDVSWSMQGETPFMAKIVHVFLDMDSIVGKDFEDGLAALKTLAES
ncbi:MAG: SRPBCC family protein, partial [Hyphomicrobium sp.]